LAQCLPSPCELLQAGNEAVLRARFEDAQFFYKNDLGTPLAEAR
jgi:glycyl-tRNA synthetase